MIDSHKDYDIIPNQSALSVLFYKNNDEYLKFRKEYCDEMEKELKRLDELRGKSIRDLFKSD